MGSSKKHSKDKERDRKKHRSSHSGQVKVKEHANHHRKFRIPERSSKHPPKRRRERTDSGSDDGRGGRGNKVPRRDPIEIHTISDDEEHEVKGSGESLSIDDTNRLRAKLGLKPLQVQGSIPGLGKEDQDEDHSDAEDKEENKEVFVRTENLRIKRNEEMLREKLQIAREKRKQMEKLSSVKGVADSDSEEDNAEKWIEKSRRIQEEKDQASKRAKLLEEMDQEFGVGALVEEEFHKAKQTSYSVKDLKGLQVGHTVSSFKEGQTVLVLKDQGVLDKDDDVLINVNMIDDEKAAKNVENKKNKPDYVAYDEPEYDEFGILKTKTMLSKYDEELDGPKKESFKIGMSSMSKEKELEIVRMKLKQKQQGVETLELPALKIATEYYTPEEMVRFKKPKKKKKVMRKRTTLKPEELASITGLPDSAKDHGSRSRKTRLVDDENGIKISVLATGSSHSEIDDMDIDNSELVNAEILAPDEDLTGVVIDDDKADLELEMALDKTRKLKQHQGAANNLEQLAKRIKRDPNEEMSDDDNPSNKDSKINIVLNSVAEFCRTLGDIPTYGLSGNREVDADDAIDFEQEMAGEEWRPQDADLPRGAWNEVEIMEQPVEISKERENEPILEEEPDVSTGLAGALKLAMKKGYLEDDTNKLASAPRHSLLQAQSYTIEEKFYDDDKFGRRDRYTGPIQDFRERDHYKPDVKLEYIDDNGRLLNAKEAFRYLSHKFHGKGPGKNKVDKRTKKLEQESKLKLMSSTDTPLNTLKLLQEKQKDLQTPYILLSGGSKALTQTSITKSK